jgi:hypothetical protein
MEGFASAPAPMQNNEGSLRPRTNGFLNRRALHRTWPNNNR